MPMNNYGEKLLHAIANSQSCLCVGLDPHLHMIPGFLNEEYPEPDRRVLFFLKKIIQVTAPYCAAFKPNLAFFEALGARGLEIFGEILDHIPADKIVIADAKRGDIGSTAQNYKKAYFDHWNVDAITLNPLMGFETLSPYLGYESKAVYVLTLTSNPGASDFLAQPFSGYPTMAEFIASRLQENGAEFDTALGMVVGATHPKSLGPVLKRFPSAPLLVPGIGSQGGAIDSLVTALEVHEGTSLISSSRSILYAGGDEENWEQAVMEKAESYKEKLKPITQHYVEVQ